MRQAPWKALDGEEASRAAMRQAPWQAPLGGEAAPRGGGLPTGDGATKLANAPPTNAQVVAALSFLVGVAVLKTLLTKFVFVHVPLPVAVSLLSCVATMLGLLPVFALRPASRRGLRLSMLPRLSVVWLAAGLDLGCTNIGLASLSVAMAQCMRAAQPVLTILMETARTRALHHPLTYASLAVVVVGAVLMREGSSLLDASLYGMGFMALGLLASSTKYVVMKESIETFKAELGPLAFLFWMEAGICVLLLPWALLNGEVQALLTSTTPEQWPLVWFAAVVGGVRALAQILLLGVASATTLSVASLAIPALTILLSFPLFGVAPTPELLAGVGLITLGSAGYAFASASPPAPSAAVFFATFGAYIAAGAMATVFAGAVAFDSASKTAQCVAFASLAAPLLLAKAHFASRALGRWGAELRRTRAAELVRGAAGGLAPSRMQRAFRIFYLIDQETPQPFRALVWYGLLSLALWTMLYAFDGGDSLRRLLSPLLSRLLSHGLFALLVTAAPAYRLLPVLLLWFTPLARKPGVDGEPVWTNDPRYLARIGAVIPCHRSAAEIAETVRSILRFLPAANIVVVDNADSPHPLDDTAEVVRAVHPDVQYVWLPMGIKSLALWTGMQVVLKCKVV